jgi:predicted Fe-Mo cluster-binding NifX family protein
MKPESELQKDRPDSLVDPYYARAAQLIIFDTDTGSCEIISNVPSLQDVKHTGIGASEVISGCGDQVLITGYYGPKALETLAASGIGIVRGADLLLSGKHKGKIQ